MTVMVGLRGTPDACAVAREREVVGGNGSGMGQRPFGLNPIPGGVLGGMHKDTKASASSGSTGSRGRSAGSPGWSRRTATASTSSPRSAVRAALRRVEEEILRDHVAHCVEHAIATGNKAAQRRKVAELMDVVGRADRQ